MDTYTKFLNEIKKVSNKRTHKITNSYGVYDAYKYYRKNKPSNKKFILKESQYFSIIRKINNYLAQSLVEGNVLTFPCFMGTLEIRKYKVEPRIDKDGKFIFKAPVDWSTTLKMWFEHKDARENKILFYTNQRDIFRIIYNKNKAKFKNKTYILFQPNRYLKSLVSQAAKNNLLDAFET